jgi:hypothetical protein
MENQKVYVPENNEATIVCRCCGAQKTANAAPFLHKGPVKVRCACGSVFLASFEKRKYYRKSVSLAGFYLRSEPARDAGDMVVEDLSSTGIGFRTNLKNKLQVNDIVKVQFVLNDTQGSKVSRNVMVRSVNDRFVGAEFCDQDVCRPLSFYLLP